MGGVELGSAPGGPVVGDTPLHMLLFSAPLADRAPPGAPLWVLSLVWTLSGLTRLFQPVGHYQAEVFKSQHHRDAWSCGLSPGRPRVLSAGHVVGSGGSDQGKDVPAAPWPQAVSTLRDILTWRQRLSRLRLISSRLFIGK